MAPSPLIIEDIAKKALLEDLGHGYDLSSKFSIDGGTQARTAITATEECIIAGLSPALTAFSLADIDIGAQIHMVDGQHAQAGDVIVEIEGSAQAILTAKQTALNFLGHLSGIASLTYQLNSLITDYPTKLTCTRATMPGIRALAYDAVRTGGGYINQFGMDDGVLITHNHVILANGAKNALTNARKKAGPMTKIGIEITEKKALNDILDCDLPDLVLLKDMVPDDIIHCVKRIDGRAQTQATGFIHFDNIQAIAAAGVDYIATDILTNSARSISFDLIITQE